MPKTTAKSKAAKMPAAAGARLIPPKDGATVRMYRIGHGDCFLLAFPGETEDKPVYVLIDCGYKPGSPAYINTTAKEVAANILEATGGHVDVAVISHEHQDHVNGITASNFKDLRIGETWLAWTEDPNDGLANSLRTKFKDKLLGLLAARNRLTAAGDLDQVQRIDEFLSFELGGDEGPFNAPAAEALLGASGHPGTSMNKKSMQLFKDKAKKVTCIRPHKSIITIPGARNLRVFALGPPRDETRLQELDPQGSEQFHSLAAASAGSYLAAALVEDRVCSPFAGRFQIPQDQAFADSQHGQFFTTYYGQDGTPLSPPIGIATLSEGEAHANPDWRRIDKDWLYSAEELALDMNNETNNTSLVLAFELGKGGKVLLFAADAQRGNWTSWAKMEWQDGDKTITARDLLGRTVLYKVGHHGSHNATLNGSLTDEHPNLAWMAQGDHEQEFTAMITAVRAWAETQKGWDHPMKAIKEALLKKASGRVFQTDKDFSNMTMPQDTSKADWDAFQSCTRGDRLYFDYTITK